MLRVPYSRLRRSNSGKDKEHPIHVCASHGDVIRLRHLLTSDPSLVAHKDVRGWTPLLVAAYHCRAEVRRKRRRRRRRNGKQVLIKVLGLA